MKQEARIDKNHGSTRIRQLAAGAMCALCIVGSTTLAQLPGAQPAQTSSTTVSEERTGESPVTGQISARACRRLAEACVRNGGHLASVTWTRGSCKVNCRLTGSATISSSSLDTWNIEPTYSESSQPLF